MTAAVDWASEPIELVTLASWRAGGWDHEAASVHVDADCGVGAAPVVASWWGTLGDLDCVTCRIRARNQILRRQEGRLA